MRHDQRASSNNSPGDGQAAMRLSAETDFYRATCRAHLRKLPASPGDRAEAIRQMRNARSTPEGERAAGPCANQTERATLCLLRPATARPGIPRRVKGAASRQRELTSRHSLQRVAALKIATESGPWNVVCTLTTAVSSMAVMGTTSPGTP
jgi:hypothetical protein